MGSFQSGKWIVGLSIYFIVFFLIVSGTVRGLDEIDEDHSLRFADPGYQVISSGDPDDYEYNGSIGVNSIDYTKPTNAYSSFKATLSVMTGINSESVNIGMPVEFRYIMSFFLFWIPIFMLIFAIYMAIPFFH